MVQIGILRDLIHFSVLLSIMCSGQYRTNPTQLYGFRHNLFNIACNERAHQGGPSPSEK